MKTEAQSLLSRHSGMTTRRESRVPPALDHSGRTADADEWGMYDPAKAGLAALFERLEEQNPIDELDAAAIAIARAKTSRLTSQ